MVIIFENWDMVGDANCRICNQMFTAIGSFLQGTKYTASPSSHAVSHPSTDFLGLRNPISPCPLKEARVSSSILPHPNILLAVLFVQSPHPMHSRHKAYEEAAKKIRDTLCVASTRGWGSSNKDKCYFLKQARLYLHKMVLISHVSNQIPDFYGKFICSTPATTIHTGRSVM